MLSYPIYKYRYYSKISQLYVFFGRAKQELKELQAMNNDAQIARDTAKSELEKQERLVYEERKKREMELAEVRKEAEEKRLQHERIERRIVSLNFLNRPAEYFSILKNICAVINNIKFLLTETCKLATLSNWAFSYFKVIIWMLRVAYCFSFFLYQ